MFFSKFLSSPPKPESKFQRPPERVILRRIGFAATESILANISRISRRRLAGYWRSGVMKAALQYGCSKTLQRIQMQRCTASMFSSRHLSGRTFLLLDRLRKSAWKLGFHEICYDYARRTLLILFMSMEATARLKCLKTPYFHFVFSSVRELWLSTISNGRTGLPRTEHLNWQSMLF
jgi:hypothetical protein